MRAHPALSQRERVFRKHLFSSGPFLVLRSNRMEERQDYKVFWIVVFALLLAGMAAFLLWNALRTDWRILYADLDPEDERQIGQTLTQAQIPFDMAANGGVLRVPAPQLDKARLATAASAIRSAKYPSLPTKPTLLTRPAMLSTAKGSNTPSAWRIDATPLMALTARNTASKSRERPPSRHREAPSGASSPKRTSTRVASSETARCGEGRTAISAPLTAARNK